MADEKVKVSSLVTVAPKTTDKVLITTTDDSGQLQTRNALLSDIRNLAASLEDSEDKAINVKIANEIVKKVTDLASEVDTSFETVNQNFTNVNNAISKNRDNITTANENMTAHEEDTDLHVTAEKQQKWDGYDQSIKDVKEIADNNTTQLNDLANPSLLINGDFRNPVNQRRKSSYNVNGEYTIDRWRFINDNNGTMTINDGYISISNGVANNTYLQYNYDTDMKVLEREKVTFTIVYKSTATYRLSSFIGSAEEDVNIYLTPIDDWTVKTLTLDLSSWKYSIGKVESSIILQSYDGSSFTNGTLDVKYIKLELGSVATPFVPRPYGEELALCQRYYEEVPAGQQVLGVKDNVNAFIYWNFIVEKRINPTVSFTHPGYDNNHVNAYSNNIELANTPVEIEWTNKRTARMKIPALSSVPIGSAISAFGAITIDAEIY